MTIKIAIKIMRYNCFDLTCSGQSHSEIIYFALELLDIKYGFIILLLQDFITINLKIEMDIGIQ